MTNKILHFKTILKHHLCFNITESNLTTLLVYVCATEISNVYSCLCMCYTAVSAELLLFLLE